MTKPPLGAAFCRAVACISLAIGTASASAHDMTYPTEIVQEGVSQTVQPGFYDYHTNGDLESTRAACLSDRTVKLYFRDNGSKTLMDVDRSSRNGFWAVGGEAEEPPNKILIKLIPERLPSPPGHRHACGGDKIVTAPISFP